MNKGGAVDLGWSNIQMVGADHSSGCLTPDQHITVGGEAAGYFFSAHDYVIYHAGNTNLFCDMEIFNELYRPTHLLIPISGHFTMGTREAALAVTKFLTPAFSGDPHALWNFPSS